MYCKHCGNPISNDAKYCSFCGQGVNDSREQDSSEKRKTEYKGTDLRCPYCKEIVSDSDIICPSCKREFRDVKSLAVVVNLTNQLAEIEAETFNNGGSTYDIAQRQERCIRNYAIPDSKNDLIALMWHAASNIEFSILEHSDASEINLDEEIFKSKKLLSEAWYDKEEQIFQRCKYLLPDDDSFPFIDNKHLEISGKYSIAKEKEKESWQRIRKIRQKEIKRQEALEKKQIKLHTKREERKLKQIELDREQQERQRKWQELEREKQSSESSKQVINNYYYSGPSINGVSSSGISGKSRSVALILCIFLGIFGAHHFYAGRPGKGILFLLTLGLIGIGWIVDIVIVATGSLQDGNGFYIKQW